MQVSKDQNFRNKKCKAMSLEGKHASNLLRATGSAITTFKNLLALFLRALCLTYATRKAGDVAAAAETKHFLAFLSEYNQIKTHQFFIFFSVQLAPNWQFRLCIRKTASLGNGMLSHMGLQLQVSSDAFKALLSQSFGIKSTTCRSSRAELRKAAETLGLPLKLADEITLAALKQLL